MRSRERIRAAKRDYDFGFSRPREVVRIKGIDPYVLDRGECPKEIVEALREKGIELGEFKVRIRDAGIIWDIKGQQNYLLKFCDKEITVYDPLISETIGEPTLGEVARWNAVSVSYLQNEAHKEGWKKARDRRLKEEEEEIRVTLRRRAFHDRLEMYDKHMTRHKTLQGLFDEKLEDGKVDVTVRDALASMQLEERETRAMSQAEAQGGNTAMDFLRLLAQSGLLERKPEVIVDAEVVSIEDGTKHSGSGSEDSPDRGPETVGEEAK